MVNVKFEIDGLSCSGCVASAERALAGVEGVEKANVTLADNTAEITYGAPANVEKLAQALQTAGYPVRSTEKVNAAG